MPTPRGAAPPLADGRRRGGEPGGRGGIASWEEMSKRGASAGDDEPASKRAKVALRVPPLLSNMTCKSKLLGVHRVFILFEYILVGTT